MLGVVADVPPPAATIANVRSLLVACAVATLAAGCGEPDAPPARTPSAGTPATGAPPPAPPPPPTPPRPGGPPEPGSAGTEPLRSIQITQVMIVYRSKTLPDAKRTREEAKAFAEDLLAQARRGTDIEKLVYEHTDDRGEDGRPFNRGSYSLHPKDPRTQAGLIAAAKATPVGTLVSEPYDSGLAFLVFRRDR